MLVELTEDQPEYRAKRLEMRARTGNLSGAIEDADWFLEQKPNGIMISRLQQLKAQLERQRDQE